MSRQTETREVELTRTCDVCGLVQNVGPRHPPVYWANAISECSWHVPADGVNHGDFKGDLCRGCREDIDAAIKKAMTTRARAPKNSEGADDATLGRLFRQWYKLAGHYAIDFSSCADEGHGAALADAADTIGGGRD